MKQPATATETPKQAADDAKKADPAAQEPAIDSTTTTTATTNDEDHQAADADDDELREQDRLLPIANVGRIMKLAVPPSAKISKEAKESVQECVSEFITFVSSEYEYFVAIVILTNNI